MPSKKSWLSILILVVGGLVTASGAESFTNRLAALQSRLQSDPTNTLLLFQLGDLCHDEGANNNPKAVILAEGYFKRLLTIDTNNAMARALYGSVLTMKARDAMWPTTRLSYVKSGNREMDAAARMAPNDAQVRFVRAVNNYHMPEVMGREEIVQADLAWLWPQAKSGDTKLSDGQRQTIALYYGDILRRKGQLDEARRAWQAGLDLAPKSDRAAKLKEQLKKHKPGTK